MNKIILTDGTTLENLEHNGSWFISKAPITADVFKGKVKTATLVYDDEAGNEISETLTNGILDRINKEDDGYWILLRNKLQHEIMQEYIKNVQDLQLGITELYESVVS